MMRSPVDVWQGCSGNWQPAFIRENLLPLGHAAWRGYLAQGRGLVACEVVAAVASVDWSRDVVQYQTRYIPAVAVPNYLEARGLKAESVDRLMETVQTYAPDCDVLIALGGHGPFEIDWLRNLAIAPPDCYHQVCDRWGEFNLEPESNGRRNDVKR
jgi:hypothetical protein